MEIVEQGEVEEMQNQICDLRLIITAALKRMESDLDIVDRWLNILDYRLRYAKGEEDED